MFDATQLQNQIQQQAMSALNGVPDFSTRPQRPNTFEGMNIADLRGTNWQDLFAQHRQGMRDYRSQMDDWRNQYLGSLGGQFRPSNPMPPNGPNGIPNMPPQAQAPQHNPVFGHAPAGMVGSSYGIPGMAPAPTGFDLPTY